ncbi:MAG TPA: hypothetical protein VK636_04850 [Gemmatimonadaceae bacterium]|nr:hypothetical protein [Gemmatimonadaceae bacterium]
MADDFSPQIAALIPGVPIALLPVRLEARFFNGGNELRVRIYPDQIHINAHESELSPAEANAGVAYWRERFASPDVKTRTTTPWATLCAAATPQRAAWIIRVLMPTNVAQIGKTTTPVFPVGIAFRPGEWSHAARATALPKRWLVIGRRFLPVFSPSGVPSIPGPSLTAGIELFRKWSANVVGDSLDVTIAPNETSVPPPGDALPLQPTARWLADFDEAERVGMAVRITLADCIPNSFLSQGVDQLFVLGVDWTVTPDVAAASLRQLMCAHAYTDGLSGLDPGTPTNVTATARPGASPSSDALVLALDPEHHPLAGSVNSLSTDRLWRGLGIVPTADDLLTTIPGGNSLEPIVTSHLINALWESTLGSYATDFMSPLVDDALGADLRDHAKKYLQPGGPYATLRIGKQPYGVLPVLPLRSEARGDTPFEDKLLKLTRALQPLWLFAADRVPRIGRTGSIDTDTTQILQTTPVASSFRFRPVLGPLAVSATTQLAPFAEVQELTTKILGWYLRWAQTPAITGFALHPSANPLKVPLVDPKPIVPNARISSTYLQAIADLARSSGTYEAVKAREDAAVLLEALVAHAVGRELHRADMRTINDYMLATGQIAALPAVGVLQAAEYVGIETVSRPNPATGVLVTTQSEASRVVIPSVTGQQTVRQFVTAAVKRGAVVPANLRPLGDMLASIEWLTQRPADQIERCLRGVLDLYSHRLDAWITSLATRRLATVRAAKPTGIYIGAYGWLEGLRVSTAPVSQGYIHTPSLPQAATAAVLRSGHLAHNDAEHKALNITLTSDRVRTAMTILDGVSQGQPLTALLGYRFERSLRTFDPLLAKYILPFRRLAPLRPDGAPPAPATPSDAIAARDVVDGVALLDRWRVEGVALLNALMPPPPQDDADSLGAYLNVLADTYDAVADVMVAEAVHQNVLGNGERAGAVLAALDRQEAPPTMDFVRTPRTGKNLTHRVLVLIGDETLPASWAGIPLDTRANAEPRLNAWIARLLGDPKRVKVSAKASGTTQALSVVLTELNLSPLSLVMAAQAPGKDAPSELEERIVNLVAARVTAPTPTTEISLLDAPPVGSDPSIIGLGALRAFLHAIYTLVTHQRAATANDLSLPQDGNDGGLDVTQLATRASAVATAHNAAIALLNGVTVTPPANTTPLRDALWNAAAFGVRAAVPPIPPLANASSSYRDDLIAQARDVLAAMRSAASREAALVTAFGAGATASVADAVAHHVERMRVLLGGDFPILARFVARNAFDITSSIGDRATLCAGDMLAPSAWLQRMALVRAGAGQLSRVTTFAEMLQGDMSPTDVLVAQLPWAPRERWLALPFAGAVPEAELSIAAVSNGAIDFTKPLAGLFCDAWPEIIPSRDEVTGMTFHYDSPGARPPQAVLIAVPPETATPGWSVAAIYDAIVEAHTLMPMRGVGPAELRWVGTVLPAMCLPFSFSDDAPAVQFDGLAAKYAAANAPTANILGKS